MVSRNLIVWVRAGSSAWSLAVAARTFENALIRLPNGNHARQQSR